MVTNTQRIDPMPVITGAAEYPEGLVEKLESAGAKVDALDCLGLAEEAGSAKAVNLVLLGRLSHYLTSPLKPGRRLLRPVCPRSSWSLTGGLLSWGGGRPDGFPAT